MVDANLDDEDDGASTESEGGDGESSEEEGGGNKKIIIIIAALLLLIGGGAGAYFAGLLDPLLGGGDAVEESHDEEGGDHGEDSHGADAGHGDSHGGGDDHGGGHGGGHDDGHGGVVGGPVFLQVPDQRVNLNATDGRNAYLQLSIQLELKNQGDKARVEAVMPRVIDQFQTYLRELRVEDLRGSQGVQRLAVELLIRVNQAAAPVEVQDVLFSEILIQEN